MEKNQSTIRFGTRIKLLKRHVREWTALLIHQKQVRFLTKERMQQLAESSIESRTPIAIIQQLTNQAIHFAQVLMRQSDERQDLKVRHELEDFTLEQAIDTHK